MTQDIALPKMLGIKLILLSHLMFLLFLYLIYARLVPWAFPETFFYGISQVQRIGIIQCNDTSLLNTKHEVLCVILEYISVTIA